MDDNTFSTLLFRTGRAGMSGGTCTLMSGGAPASSSSNVLTFLSHSAPQHLMVVHVDLCMTSIRLLTPPMRAPESRVMSVADHDGIFCIIYHILFPVWSGRLAVAQSVSEAMASSVEHLGGLFGSEVFASGHSRGYGAFLIVERHIWLFYCMLRYFFVGCITK